MKTYQECLTWIHSHKANGRRPKDERMAFVLNRLGNPQNKLPLIHIVGTNGKGSTTAYLQALFSTAGYHCGTFTSPYITRFNERIRIDNQEISDHDLLAICQRLRPVLADLPSELGTLTEFELVTVIMFAYFAQEKPDLAIIEAGIGGLLDATNCFCAQAVVCTSISYDHTDTLGSTLADIAHHKVGVLGKGVPLIVGDLADEALAICYNKAKNCQSPIFVLGNHAQLTRRDKQSFDLHFQHKHVNNIRLTMAGKYQEENASLAIMTALLLQENFPKLNPEYFQASLARVQVAGRCEYLQENLLIDGAHNEAAIKQLALLLSEEKRPIKVLFAGLKRKSVNQLLPLLSAFDVSVTTFGFPQAQSLQDYPAQIPKIEDFTDWFKLASDDPDTLYVMTGSLYFVSAARRAFAQYQQTNMGQQS